MDEKRSPELQTERMILRVTSQFCADKNAIQQSIIYDWRLHKVPKPQLGISKAYQEICIQFPYNQMMLRDIVSFLM